MSTSDSPRKRTRWLIGIGSLVILIAVVFIGSRIYAGSVTSQADDSPTLAPQTSVAAPTTIDGTWTSTTGSYAGYRLDEVLNGSDVTVTGRTENVSATLTVSDQELIDASVSLQVAEITTDSERRDNYFHNTAIDTAQYPEATFTLTEAIDVSVALDGGSSTIPLTGELTINGHTQTVTVDALSVFGQDTAQIVGQIPVTWSDYGVSAPNLGFVSVQDAGFVEFSLNVQKS